MINERDRTILRLRERGLTHRAIGEKLGLSTGYVGQILRRWAPWRVDEEERKLFATQVSEDISFVCGAARISERAKGYLILMGLEE
jgi:hypothetical protein